MKRKKSTVKAAAMTFAVLACLSAGGAVSASTPDMVWIAPGTFIMGSPTNEAERYPDEVQHAVTLTSGFYMGKYLVTQNQYASLMGVNPSYHTPVNGFTEDLNRPVEQVSWYDATNYCVRLTIQEQAAGHISTNWVYRLPTEAEWEYACRAGTTTAFNFGNAIRGGMANFYDYWEYDAAVGSAYVSNPSPPWINCTTPVGSYTTNAWGLYDMHGNVWEWCLDWKGEYPHDSVVNPRGPVNGRYRVLRGGCGGNSGDTARSAYREIGYEPESKRGWFGFRVVLVSAFSPAVQVVNEAIIKRPICGGISKQVGKDSLVVITHGWINPLESAGAATAWVDIMSNAVSAHSQDNWQVAGYKWIEDASVLLPEGPQTALGLARSHGTSLGRSIAAQGWTHVHLIAHSAGAALIDACAKAVKSAAPDMVVQCTFLDAFVGFDYAGRIDYGVAADWSDSYFSRDALTGGEAHPYTEGSLLHAFNVDVTRLDPNKVLYGAFSSSGSLVSCYTTRSSHGYPIEFYGETIDDSLSGSSGFGFPLSEEGGNWGCDQYDRGNNQPLILGAPDTVCNGGISDSTTSPYNGIPVDFSAVSTERSTTGIIQASGLQFSLTTDSPAWLASFVTITDAVNMVSFDGEFTSEQGAEGILSVYWDTNMIGMIDERVVQPGFRHYTFSFPRAEIESVHMLGFRLDPFTDIASTAVITNVAIGCVGVSKPFNLSVTTDSIAGLPVMQLIGQPGFDYIVQASVDPIGTNWTDIAVLSNTNGTVRFIDPDSVNHGFRFYRAVAP